MEGKGSMERLTYKTNGNYINTAIEQAPSYSIDCDIDTAITKLAEYEDLEEQGKLLKLPCTVGDMTYWADAYSLGGIVRSAVVKRIEIDVEGIYVITSLTTHSLDDFGKTVFLSEEAAEAALKNLSQLQSRKQR